MNNDLFPAFVYTVYIECFHGVPILLFSLDKFHTKG